ncbi:MAG TPA: DUF2306 domain-containing protein [Pseudorhizobium sp.]|nr:DUF2306 domain-containing protein [Pseudorhizobium sp.]
MNSLVQRASTARAAFWWMGALASIAIAVASYRYLLGVGPMPSGVVANAFAAPWLLVHVAGAATALLVGSFQFIGRLRQRSPALHRWNGRIYAVACLVGAVSGLLLALGTTAGPVAMSGFGILAVIWAVTIGYGWQRARERRFPEHRRWMIRSWALTFAAVNLRAYLMIAGAMGIPFEVSYPIISFLAWVPNLILAEIYLSRTDRGRSRSPDGKLAIQQRG